MPGEIESISRLKYSLLFSLISILILLSLTCDIKNTYQDDQSPTGVNIKTITPQGEILSSQIYITDYEDRDVIIEDSVSGVLIQLQPGIYDLKIVCREEMKWLDDIEVEEFEVFSRKVVLPNAQIIIHCEDSEKESLSLPVYIYKSGIYDKAINSGWSDERLNVPPGIYDIEVFSEGESIWISEIELNDEELYNHTEVFKR